MGLGTGQTLEEEIKNKRFIEGVEVLKILRLWVKKEKVLAAVDNIQNRRTECKGRKEGAIKTED